jgi:hypothetical protein
LNFSLTAIRNYVGYIRLRSLFRVKDRFNEFIKKYGVTCKTDTGLALSSKINGIKTIATKNSYDYQHLYVESESQPKSPLEGHKKKTSPDIGENVANDIDDMKVAAAYDDIIEFYDRINEVGDDVLNEFINKTKVDR